MTTPATTTSTATHAKESAFHDQWAAGTPLGSINVREAFEAPTAPENRFIRRRMGDLRGKRVLDVGAGLGESSVYFALQGAAVTATDLSPAMVDTAVRLGRLHGVSIDGPGHARRVAGRRRRQLRLRLRRQHDPPT